MTAAGFSNDSSALPISLTGDQSCAVAAMSRHGPETPTTEPISIAVGAPLSLSRVLKDSSHALRGPSGARQAAGQIPADSNSFRDSGPGQSFSVSTYWGISGRYSCRSVCSGTFHEFLDGGRILGRKFCGGAVTLGALTGIVSHSSSKVRPLAEPRNGSAGNCLVAGCCGESLTGERLARSLSAAGWEAAGRMSGQVPLSQFGAEVRDSPVGRTGCGAGRRA